MKRFFLLLALLLTGAPAWAQVIGNIDGVVLSGTQYRINGWACDTGVTASIDVHVYVGGPAGAGTGIAIVTASNTSEAAVATRCQTSGTAYRFSIPISDSIRTQHSNKKIYIHGISQTGGSNLTINNSGVFLVPPPLSQTRSYVYNAAQELCKTIEPETGATVMHYDGAGNLDWSAAGLNLTSTTSCQDTDASITARKVTRTYDARNRLKTLNFPDTKGNQAWTYFPDGLPASIAVTNPNVANPTLTSYAYNRRRLLTGESLNHLGGTTVWGAGYGYDANGALKIQTYPSGLSIDYAPNALGQPTQAGTYATGVSYYPNGAIAQFTYGNGIKHTLTQNLRQLPDRSLDDYGTSKFLDDSYDYDQNGNVAAISDGLTGNRGNRTMTYDELDRLTKVDSPMYGTDAANHMALYGYDGLDNLTGIVIGGTKARLLTYCYDANWRLTNVKNNFNGEGCAGSTVIGLSYDVQGNLANKNGQAFEFDYGNRLRNVPGKEWYAYDGQGRRVLSCTSAACSYQMYSQAGQLLTSQDYRNNKRVESIYLGGSLVALRELETTTSTTTTKYQHTDALGSPVAETNSSRAILEKSEYEPFGQVLNRPLEDGPGYTGHTLDASTGLNYMQQRYYDPNIGRFLSADPVTTYGNPISGFNRYRYAANNPYMYTDPDGRIDWKMLGDSFKLEASVGLALEVKGQIGPLKGSLGAGAGMYGGGFTLAPDGYAYQEVAGPSAGVEFGPYGFGYKGSVDRSYQGRYDRIYSEEKVKGGVMLGLKKGKLTIEEGGTNAKLSGTVGIAIAKLSGSIDFGKAWQALQSPAKDEGNNNTSNGFQGVFEVNGRIESKQLDNQLKSK